MKRFFGNPLRLRLARRLNDANIYHSIQSLSTISPDIYRSKQRLLIPPGSSTVRYYRACDILNSSSPTVQTMEFQAETRKLLDIVTNSIYTDKEVFIRELISNASDALEKYRYKQVTGEANNVSGDNSVLGITITTDADSNTLTLSDNGIGMSRDELISNLGTIARSGSKLFVEQYKGGNNATNSDSSSSTNVGDTTGIIGQFGVGFYSSFMVADTVTVESIPATVANTAETSDTQPSSIAHKWVSDGSGTFTIEECLDSEEIIKNGRGTRIVMKLKDKFKEFAQPEKIKRYSIMII